MARIPRETIDEIRERVDIVSVVQKHVSLNRRGKSYKGLCPFHQEKSPSFHVIPDKGIFHCFGCQTGGDAFKFLMLLEGLSFIEAVKELAGSVGITIEERELSPEDKRNLKQRATSYDVLSAASEFFRSMLWTRPEGAKARSYVHDRSLDESTAQDAGLGFAPDAWSQLTDHLHGLGYNAQLIGDVGLSKTREGRSGSYDTFRNRLIFPIRDERGRVIGFGGRLLDGDGPKYLNSPETSLYDKSRVLYGLYEGRSAIQQKKRIIIVEGYMDVLAMRQAGFAEAVATCGTALTSQHMTKLRRLADRAIVLFDSDAAGMRAAEKSLPMFVEADIQPWRLDLPDAKDPDEFLVAHGAEAMEKALESPPPLYEWLLDRRVADGNYSSAGIAQLLDELTPLLRQLPPSMRALTAQKLRIREDILIDRLRKAPVQPEQRPQAPARVGWRPTQEIVHVLWLLVHRYDHVADLVQRAPPTLLDEHTPVIPVIARLVSGEPVAAVLQDTEDPGVQRTLSAIVGRTELYEVASAAAGMLTMVDRLSRRRRLSAIEALTRASQKALEAQDMEGYRTAATERMRQKEREELLEAALARGDAEVTMQLIAEALAPTDD
ncbi:MAG: DNA primase [Myxococcota bacterium]|jgi:DNA primase